MRASCASDRGPTCSAVLGDAGGIYRGWCAWGYAPVTDGIPLHRAIAAAVFTS